MNIEQSKLLNTRHLKQLLGGGLYKDLRKQRHWLGELATEDTITSVLQLNAQQLDLDNQSDFYLDPHTKHYTGEKNLLKGWCSGIGRVDKVLHSDFIHTVEGHPLYFETTDNFLDLRERTFALLGHFRETLAIDEKKPLTFIIDRGIFGADIFAEFASRPNLHLITWEKDYRNDAWDTSQPAAGTFLFERPRNHSKDLRGYRFSYQEHPWPKDPNIRRIIVRATNPRGRTVEVAILTDDLTRDAEEIILLIFRRWLQENDFKYLHKHFGIDQITSYKALRYEDLAEEITDKTMQNSLHRRLTKQRQNENNQLKNLLWKRERAQRRESQRKETIVELEKALEQSRDAAEQAALRKELGVERSQQKRAQSKLLQWEQAIEKQHAEIAKISQELEETAKEESRLEKLIENKTVKLKGAPKRLMDALKILGRNLFYTLLSPFKNAYDNYRDDHVIFRSLTTSGGLIEADANTVTCHLLVEPDYPRAIRKHLGDYLDQWNAQAPVFPDGSGRPITLKLITTEGFQVAFPDLENDANH